MPILVDIDFKKDPKRELGVFYASERRKTRSKANEFLLVLILLELTRMQKNRFLNNVKP